MAPSSERQPDLEALLDYLKRSRGFDFTGYKRTSLARRIQKRMQSVQTDGYGTYQEYLEKHPREFEELFDTILINVTAFFRDDDAWNYLRTEVVPPLIAQKGPTEPIRVWSAGCASGEEAYSLAIAFAEALGPEEFRERVKIYATDADEAALVAARHATYAAKDVESLSADLVEKYFERSDARYAFRKDLRRSVVFGRNDLIQDAPISRIDLLACRNVLMYFDAATQGRILSRFYFALNAGGYLFLGRAETLLTHTTTFTPVDLKRRVFQKVTRGSGVRLLPARGGPGFAADDRVTALDVRDAALRASSVAQLIVDRQGTLVFANDRAGELFRLGMADVGRPLSDLELSYRPIDVRSLIDQAYSGRRVVVRAGVEWRSPGASESQWFDVQVTPLHGEDGTSVGTSVSFTDMTTQRQLQAELEHSEHELQAAYGELQSTNEELETTNEELQSTVEELETTNEELQSTNEELETINEELYATNEELQTMNDELQMRSDELNQLNRFLEQVFTSLRHGVAVVDPDFRVLVWNRRAEDMWGLRAEEVEGTHFLSLDIGLPVDQLRQPIRNALVTGDGAVQEMVVPATTRRGRKTQCRVVCAPLVGRDGTGPEGVIVLMEEVGAQE
jgi:two-component system, chemotaxis family, CheB/CheR fusion protein